MSNDAILNAEDFQAAHLKYIELIGKHHADDENLAAIKQDFDAWVEASYDKGSFTIHVEKLVAAHLWQRENSTAGQNTKRVLREIESGQIAIAVDAWLDLPLTVGEYRRTLVRHYRPSDGLLMIGVRKEHYEDAKRSLADVRTQVKAADALVKAHGSIPGAFKAGALSMVEPDEGAA